MGVRLSQLHHSLFNLWNADPNDTPFRYHMQKIQHRSGWNKGYVRHLEYEETQMKTFCSYAAPYFLIAALGGCFALRLDIMLYCGMAGIALGLISDWPDESERIRK